MCDIPYSMVRKEVRREPNRDLGMSIPGRGKATAKTLKQEQGWCFQGTTHVFMALREGDSSRKVVGGVEETEAGGRGPCGPL